MGWTEEPWMGDVAEEAGFIFGNKKSGWDLTKPSASQPPASSLPERGRAGVDGFFQRSVKPHDLKK